MRKLLGTAASVAGLLGALVSLLAGISRVTGGFHLGGFESMTVFVGGIGLMVFSVVLKLELIHDALKNPR